MIHFLHTADWQIGRQYGQFEPGDAALLAEARFDAVGTIARLATERGVDAVLVAGDVFDTQAVGDRTLRRLFAALAGYAGPWLLISGNHDAALADSVWTRAQRLGCLPPNVWAPGVAAPHVATAAAGASVIDLADLGLAVLAAPLLQRHTYDDATRAFDDLPTAPGRFRVGLAHGSVQGRLFEGIDAANPIAADRAERARLDYLALGDWHGCLRVDARTWYAGTPEAERFRDNAPGFVLDVRIDAPGAVPLVEPVAVGRYRWSQWRERIEVAADVDALAHRLDALGAADVLRLEVGGQVDVDGAARLSEAVARAAARVRALDFDASALALAPGAADLAALGVDGYLRGVVAQLRAMQGAGGDGGGDSGTSAGTDGDAPAAREALRLLVQLHRDDAAPAPGPRP